MKRTLAVLAALALTGCATVVSGTQQSIFVETPFTEGASCTLQDSKHGNWYLQSTPASISVLKGNGPMNITCKKQGFQTASVSVEDEFAGATLGNIILGGGIGVFVDAASGAAQKYPDKVVIWMKPQKWASTAQRKEWEDAKAAYEKEIAEKQEAQRRAQQSRQNQ